MSEQAGNTGPGKERARAERYLSPLILNHASAHCRCAAPSSSLQQQPSRITSDPGAADPPPSSGPSWQIRHPTPGGAAAATGTPSTSMTTAPVGSTAAATGGEAPAAEGAAATASRRMRGGSGSGQRARVGRGCFGRRLRQWWCRAGGWSGGGGGGYKRRRGTRGWRSLVGSPSLS